MRDVLLTLFILGTIPFILYRPYIGILVWSWIGFMNPHRLTWGFARNLPWVQLIAIVTLLAMAMTQSQERRSISWSAGNKVLLAFFLWTTISTAFALVQPSALNQWEVFAKVLIMIFVTQMLIQTPERLNWLVWVVAVSIGFYGIKGGLFTIIRGGGGHVYGPPHSFIQNNNDLALALCMVLPLMRYLQLHSTRKWVRLGLIGAMGLTVLSILATYSRGGALALAAMGFFLFLKSRKKLLLSLGLIVIVPAAVIFMPAKWTARMYTVEHYQQNESAMGRIYSWEFATNLALHRPLTGGGFNPYQSTSLWQRYAPAGAVQRAVHSIYFRVLGEQGFVGLGLFLLLLFIVWRTGTWIRKRTRGRPEWQQAYDLASMLQVSLIAYIVGGAFLTRSYFDLAYDMFAMMMIVRAQVQRGMVESPAREPAPPVMHGKPLSHGSG